MSSFNKQKRVFTLNDKAAVVLFEVTKSTKEGFKPNLKNARQL